MYADFAMKKCAAVTILLLVVVLASCENGDGNGDETALNIGVVVVVGERLDRDVAAMETLAAERGHTLTVHQSLDTDLQDAAIASMIGQGVDALVVMAQDGTSPVAQSWPGTADQSGIPFINFDRLIPNATGIDFYVTFDDVAIGRIQGEYIRDNTSNGDSILMFRGATTDGNADEFETGSLGVLQPLFDLGTRTLFGDQVYVAENWDPGVAKTIVEGFGDVPAIDAILSPNDGVFLGYTSPGTSGGIYEGLQFYELTGTQFEALTIVGQDAQLNAVQAIAGSPQIMDMTILKDYRQLLPELFDAVEALVDGRQPSSVQTVNNGVADVPAFLGDPAALTAENYVELVVDTGIFDQSEIDG